MSNTHTLTLGTIAKQFNQQYQVTVKNQVTRKSVLAALWLMEDEHTEAYNELGTEQINEHDAVKEVIDIIYVASQQLAEMGVDVDLALALVHQSNMSKLIDSRELTTAMVESELELAKEKYPDVVLERVDEFHFRMFSPSNNKVIKPTTYTLANITPALPTTTE